jgi:translocator protein
MKDLKNGLVAALPVFFAWVLGQLATFPNLVPWYVGLVKPSYNPPNWIFGPVWIALYILMIVAAWRVLRLPHVEKSGALTAFYLQLALNAAWSWMFFAAHSPLLGLINIIPQFALVLLTIAKFSRIDRLSGFVLVPLALWVGFAAILNISIWWLNI